MKVRMAVLPLPFPVNQFQAVSISLLSGGVTLGNLFLFLVLEVPGSPGALPILKLAFQGPSQALSRPLQQLPNHTTIVQWQNKNDLKIDKGTRQKPPWVRIERKARAETETATEAAVEAENCRKLLQLPHPMPCPRPLLLLSSCW